MVTTVSHIKHTLGLDITLPDHVQSRKNLLEGSNLTDDAMKNLSPSCYLEPIYDVVTGIDEHSGCHFDFNKNDDGKFKSRELRQLAELATRMKNRPGTLEGQKTVLTHITKAANTYQKFLDGETNIIKKDVANLANRHTLLRGTQGHVYEMTNNEINRFKRKTGMLIESIEKPKFQYQQNGQKFIKIELGKGAFGKTRIARDIDLDKYVAVKKIHPKLAISANHGIISKNPEQSNFYNLNKTTKEDLKNVKDFVITPDDELVTQSRTSKKIANTVTKLKNWHPSNVEEIFRIIAALPDISEDDILNLSKEDQIKFAANLVAGKFSDFNEINHTAYNFSELGITNIDRFICNLNVLRIYFESNNTINELNEKSKNTLVAYSKLFHQTPANISTQKEFNTFHQKTMSEIYNSDKFKLKDPIHNQLFLNTLGKKMLTALATLNNKKLSHQDIKPDNIVFVQNGDKNVSVKLIDIDLLKMNDGPRKQPSAGCIPFMPPEALINERDGSVSYLGIKGDAYAMGLALRRSLGFSLEEVIATSQIQKIKVAIESKNIDGLNQETVKKLEESIRAMNLSEDAHVQNQLHIKAVINTVPEAVSLKDMSDLMLKEHPGKRVTADDVLSDFSFFNDSEKILTDEEFSDYVLRINRFGMLIDEGDIHRINDASGISSTSLAMLRQNANNELIRSRQQVPDGPPGSSLSANETEQVSKTETLIQAQAGMRRLGRSMSAMFIRQGDIADQKLQYKKR